MSLEDKSFSYVSVAWLLKEKQHMKQLFTRPLITDKKQQQKNTAAYNAFEDLNFYHAFWHMKVGSCVIYVTKCVTETTNLEISWQEGCK